MGSCGVFLIYLLTFFVTFILQSVGLFTPYWISWEDCDAQGLFYYKSSNETNGCYGPGSSVSNSAFVLEIISFVLHLVVCVIRMYLICRFDWDCLQRLCSLAFLGFTSDTTQPREQDSAVSKQGEITEHYDIPESGGMKLKAIGFVRFMR